MTYEIRVVFQSPEAYESAVEGLYRAFGVELSPANAPPRSWAEPRSDALPAAPVRSLDNYLAEDPPTASNDGYTFTVEDQTRR